MIMTAASIPNFELLLASHYVDGQPKLVFLDWLTADDAHAADQDSKSLGKLKRHYRLTDDDITFIQANSLSKENDLQDLLLTAIQQLNDYVAGNLATFELPLDISMGTAFQQRVWQALQAIPYGQTISYAQLAVNIGQPTAFRAVANANGKNPFSIVIPCHRVIASGGGLGGYTGGLDKKRYLLDIEAS